MSEHYLSDDAIKQAAKQLTGGYIPKPEQFQLIRDMVAQEKQNRKDLQELALLLPILKQLMELDSIS